MLINNKHNSEIVSAYVMCVCVCVCVCVCTRVHKHVCVCVCVFGLDGWV